MAIRIIDEYPGKVGAATPDYPEGVPRNVSSPGALDGTPWEEILLRDTQGFFQGLLAQVPAGAITPSGAPDTVLVSQYIDAMKLIIQGLNLTTFTNPEVNVNLVLQPDGVGGSQWGPGAPSGLRYKWYYNANGTWVKPSWVNYVIVHLIGAGGGAGYANEGGFAAATGGGGAGAYAVSYLDATPFVSEPVIVGVGGAGGNAIGVAGAAGGFSEFSTGLTQAGGGQGSNAASALSSQGGTGGVIQALAPNLTSSRGGGGQGGFIAAGVPSPNAISGAGGTSFYGGASPTIALGSLNSGSGNAIGSSLALGSGATGSVITNTGGGVAGGNGADGLVIIEGIA